MKLLALALVCAALAAAQVAHGQEAELPSRALEEPEPTPAGVALPTPPPQLIPDDILPAPDLSPKPTPAQPGTTIPQLDESFQEKPLSAESENRRLHIEWRKLRNRVQNDAEVRAALARAEAARTDLEKRKLLARYFEIFFGKMMAIAPADMKGYLQAKKAEHLAALPQPSVRPSGLPAPTPVPAVAGLPASSPPPLPAPTPTTENPALLPPPSLDSPR
jgi:hypothetical protein